MPYHVRKVVGRVIMIMNSTHTFESHWLKMVKKNLLKITADLVTRQF